MDKIEKLQKELSKEGYVIKIASELNKEEKIRTGVFALDYVLDGGISIAEGGHRLEFFGAESCGKTTFALYIIKKFQELGKSCAFIDAEQSYDRDWGEKLGIDNEKLLIIYPDTLEQLGDILVKTIPEVDLVVVDSIVGLIPEGEAERDTAEAQMALSARVLSLITRKIYHATTGRNTTLIFINQLREKVGVMYGSPYTTAGGHALKHMYNCLDSNTVVYDGSKFITLKYVKNKITSYDFEKRSFVNNKIKAKIISKNPSFYILNLGITEIIASGNHKFYVLTNQGKIELKEVKNIYSTDMFLSAKGDKLKVDEVSFTDSDITRILGYYVGDGCHILENSIIDFCDKNRKILEYYQNILIKRTFPINKRKEANSHLLYIRKGFINHIFETIKTYKLDIESNKKVLPVFFYNFSIECLRHFIAGFYDAEGADNSFPQMFSSSKPLLENIQFMLWRLGINSYIKKRKHFVKKIVNQEINKEYTIYILMITDSENIKKFKDLIPTLKNIKESKYKPGEYYNFNSLIQTIYKKAKENKILNDINYLKRLTKRKIIQFSTLLQIYNQIKTIEIFKEETENIEKILKLKLDFDFFPLLIKKECFASELNNCKYFKKGLIDIEVNKDNNFLANGMLSHNSRIEFKVGKPIEEKEERIGLELKLNCVKNKRGKAYRKTEIDFFTNGYIDNNKSLFFAGIKYGVIQRVGNTYEFDKVKAVGQEKFVEAMKKEDWDKLEKQIWDIDK